MPSASRARMVLSVASSPVTVFVVALAARLGVLRQLLPAKAWSGFYAYNEFARIAWAVVSGYGYSSPWAQTPLAPTAVEPPIYTYLLAGIFRLAGSYSYVSLWIAVTLNAVLSAVTAVLVLRLGKRDFGAPTGVLAAWVWSCWLYEAVVSVRLWESTLSALLLVIALLSLPGLAGSPRWPQWLSFGALAGLAALTNTTLLSLFPFFWLWLWITCRRRGRSCTKLLLASIAICILALVPWTIRNYTTFHRVMPVRDNFGLELWLGNHQGVTNVFDNDFPILDPTEYNRLGEIGFMESKREIALQFIGEHPLEFLWLSARRCFKYWTAPKGSAWLWISLLAWLGLLLALQHLKSNAVPSAIVMLVFPSAYYVTHTFPQYRHPIESVVLLLASYAATRLLRMAGRVVEAAHRSRNGCSPTGSQIPPVHVLM